MERNLVLPRVVAAIVAFVVAFYALNSYSRYQELNGGPNGPSSGVSDEGARQRPDVPQTGLIGIWSWQQADSTDGTTLKAPPGDRFVLTFDEDGLMSSLTDCNTLSGDYSRVGDSGLRFGPMMSTLMFCEGSLEGEYAPRLASTESFVIENDTLTLILSDRGGVMVFRRMAPADDASVRPGAGGKHPGAENIAYVIEGETVTLVGGTSADGATHFFGNLALGDLDGDGREDAAFLLTRTGQGSGTFYYVAVALMTDDGYVGTNALLLGDRIAPQTTEVRDGGVIVNYADRQPGEPFSARPSLGVSKYFVVSDGILAARR